MDYVCPVCKKIMERELLVIIPHTEEHIMNEIKKKRPHWVDRDGICRKCYEYYKDQMRSK